MQKRTVDGLRLMHSISAEWSDKDIAEAYSGSFSEAIVNLELAKSDLRKAFACGVGGAVQKMLDMLKTKSHCQKGIKVVFLDGEVREVFERTFSRCLVQAAYMRLTEGACSHRELTVDIQATKSANTRIYSTKDPHDSNGLLPCPFCGGNDLLIGIGWEGNSDGYVHCRDCGGHIRRTRGRKKAASKAWNTRAL